jgi:GT2 family glycosyltransferase
MKVGCILLTCGRSELTLQVIKHNFWNSGKDADVYLVDNGSVEEDHQKVLDAYHFKSVYRFETNKGIAAAINKGITMALADQCNAIVTLANDILMPDGWLATMVEYATKIENTGMAGIHCVEGLEPVNEFGVHPAFTAFGNVLIPKKAIDKIGYFNTAFDPYGMQDADYAFRLNNTGFLNYYLPDMKAEHIGHDVGNGSEYRKMKDEGLNTALDKYNRLTEKFKSENNFYIPSNQAAPTQPKKKK